MFVGTHYKRICIQGILADEDKNRERQRKRKTESTVVTTIFDHLYWWTVCIRDPHSRLSALDTEIKQRSDKRLDRDQTEIFLIETREGSLSYQRVWGSLHMKRLAAPNEKCTSIASSVHGDNVARVFTVHRSTKCRLGHMTIAF